ncbi:MAG: alpha/beta fold hydrolase [Verrucomicrobiota bacterium]
MSLPIPASGSPFEISSIEVGEQSVSIHYPAREGYYYVLHRGEKLESIARAIDLAVAPGDRLTDSSGAAGEAFYRVEQIPLTEAKDLDGDGLTDAEELGYPGILDPLDPADADRDFDNDGRTNKQELKALFGASDPGEAVFTDLTLKTDDGFTIAASFGVPDNGVERVPAVVFIHQGGSDRGEWETVAKDAFRRGWATLAYDIRGHGDSSGTWTNAWFDDPDKAPSDLQAALEHLRSHERVDSNRIAVVGASVGGNLACVASALYSVKTVVALSHKTSAVFNLAGREDLEFRSIFHLSTEGDQGGQRANWAKELYEQTAEPRRLEIVSGSAHGVSMFKTDAAVPDRILEWLEETL